MLQFLWSIVCITIPIEFELLQCRMQIQGADSLVLMSSRYSSPLDCIAKTLKTEGVRKLCNIMVID